MDEYVVDFAHLRMSDVGRVGGKNASLGEMITGLSHLGVRVPEGFATTADAYREFLAHGGLAGRIVERMKGLDVDDTNALAAAGAEIRGWITEAPLPSALRAAVVDSYEKMIAAAGKWRNPPRYARNNHRGCIKDRDRH